MGTKKIKKRIINSIIKIQIRKIFKAKKSNYAIIRIKNWRILRQTTL